MEQKRYPTIGVCGLDCGLCPRYYTEGTSRCPGCYGPDFSDKHPSCGFITCCVKKKGLEVCAECSDFPCSRFGESDEGEYDSFLTYRKVRRNLSFIKEHGVEEFVALQRKRMDLLEEMLAQFNEGRSKSLYCVAATLLSIDSIEESIETARREAKMQGIDEGDVKSRAKVLKGLIREAATEQGIDLKLRKPPKRG